MRKKKESSQALAISLIKKLCASSLAEGQTKWKVLGGCAVAATKISNENSSENCPARKAIRKREKKKKARLANVNNYELFFQVAFAAATFNHWKGVVACTIFACIRVSIDFTNSSPSRKRSLKKEILISSFLFTSYPSLPRSNIEFTCNNSLLRLMKFVYANHRQ